MVPQHRCLTPWNCACGNVFLLPDYRNAVDLDHYVQWQLRHVDTPKDEVRRCYATLEVPFGADLAPVNKGYRKLAMKYHPDHNKTPEAHARMTEINQAYEFLRRYLRATGDSP